jgi:NhaP-type Na+/H+ or K+/H+ antiporter
MIAGLLMTRVVKLVHLPNVTGYLIAGLLIGPYCLKLISNDTLATLDILTVAALGFIAFSIGGEFKFTYLRKVGKGPVLITILEAMGAVILVLIGLLIAGFPLPLALCLGAIAAATAPAATIMVIRQYKAKGPLTETLMTVVAMDDAVALMAFGIAAGIARTMISSSSSNILASVFQPLLEIVLSLGLGLVLGLLMAVPLRWFRKDGNRTILMLGFVLLGVGLAELFELSGLLLCMAAGAAAGQFFRPCTWCLPTGGRVYTSALSSVFCVVRRRNESFRTAFDRTGGDPVHPAPCGR